MMCLLTNSLIMFMFALNYYKLFEQTYFILYYTSVTSIRPAGAAGAWVATLNLSSCHCLETAWPANSRRISSRRFSPFRRDRRNGPAKGLFFSFKQTYNNPLRARFTLCGSTNKWLNTMNRSKNKEWQPPTDQSSIEDWGRLTRGWWSWLILNNDTFITDHLHGSLFSVEFPTTY